MDCDLRLELRVKNNMLWHAIFDVYPNVAAFCRAFGLSQSIVGALINLRQSPYDVDGEPTLVTQKICEATGFGRDYLFPPHLYKTLMKQKYVAELPSSALGALKASLALPPAQDDDVNDLELHRAVDDALATLKPREAQVMRLRFGLDGGDEQMPEEIAKEVNLCRQRIYQVQAKALRKLRHPSRSRKLRSFLEGRT
jgi:RNA polymerase sigma factor (sigma-70 family)